jgi:hypothetical protein
MALMATGAGAGHAQSLAERNEIMFQQMQQIRGVSGGEMRRIRAIFAASPNGWMGQGNPAVTQHPLSPEEAAARLGGSVSQIQESYRNRQYERICGERYMVPLYDPATQSPVGRHGLRRHVRIPQHPDGLPGRLGPRERGRAALRRRGQADGRRP